MEDHEMKCAFETTEENGRKASRFCFNINSGIMFNNDFYTVLNQMFPPPDADS